MLDKVDPIDDEDLLYDPDAKGQLGRIVSHRGKEHNGRVHYCLFRCYPLGLHRRDDVKHQIIGGNLGLMDRWVSFIFSLNPPYTFLHRPDNPLPNARSN
ncbi:hypothetical protein L208DRAFT_1403198 [Tricholoma matsutake]|nr:hypothetical protein L208DRAFT_1403198 [Tricholoma matsutake 945]